MENLQQKFRDIPDCQMEAMLIYLDYQETICEIQVEMRRRMEENDHVPDHRYFRS